MKQPVCFGCLCPWPIICVVFFPNCGYPGLYTHGFTKEICGKIVAYKCQEI